MKTLNLIQQKVVYLFATAIVCLALVSFVIIQGILIKGKVVDESGAVLPGVSINVKGTSIGTITDANGMYSIKVPDDKSVLVFSFIGYQSREIVVKSAIVINVKMKASEMTLNEVVVISELKQEYSKAARAAIPAGSNDMSMSNQVYYNPSTEDYSKINENGFRNSKASPLSTFSIDVDRASYSNVKRFLNNGQLPPADAVRIEEMINYFEYDYPQPTNQHPFSITTEYSDCPWQAGHKLLHIGIQGKKIPVDNLPPSNLVFLIDVSGSMSAQNKLPLLKSAFKLLVNNLRSNDRVAIVVYAGAAGLVLPSTRGNDKSTILDALDRLQSGGSTAGAEGIQMAYDVAKENFIREGNNRIILATDGDFNVGVSNNNELEDLITAKRKTGIFLTCLGFGMGNYKDSKMEILADKGNGNYAYINDIQEANKVLVNEFGGTLFTIAKDVKIQVEFNPARVQAYRLVGYENRMLNTEDFKDDAKDAGELGSGHTVTAIYEIIPAGVRNNFIKDVDDLKYQPSRTQNHIEDLTGEVATIKFRYKKPDGDISTEIVHPVTDEQTKIAATSNNYRFSVSVAMFGMLLRNSEYKGTSSYNDAIDLAENAKGKDKDGYRAEFVRLVKTAKNGAYSVNRQDISE